MYGYGHDAWMHGSGMFGGGPLMFLMWLIPVALLVALIVYVTRRPGAGSDQNSALDILNKRYARGEIAKDEFDRMKRDIGS